MTTTNIENLILQVLDAPTEIRLIIETKYPHLENGCVDKAYFMVDHGDCGTGDQDAQVFDHWKVSDSLGQYKEFYKHIDLLKFIKSIEPIIENVYIDSF